MLLPDWDVKFKIPDALKSTTIKYYAGVYHSDGFKLCTTRVETDSKYQACMANIEVFREKATVEPGPSGPAELGKYGNYYYYYSGPQDLTDDDVFNKEAPYLIETIKNISLK